MPAIVICVIGVALVGFLLGFFTAASCANSKDNNAEGEDD